MITRSSAEKPSFLRTGLGCIVPPRSVEWTMHLL
jgi:hypothetical protein